MVVQLWAIFCPSSENLLFFSKTFPKLVLDSWGSTLFLSSADMLACCCFCSGKFQCPHTAHLSSPPLLVFTLFWILVFASPNSFGPSAYTFLLRISPLISEVENISGDPRLFPATFLPKYLTGCISHCCIMGNHGIDVYNLIPQSNEWCKFPTYRCLQNACHIWVPQLFKIKPWSWLIWLSRLWRTRKSSSPGHGHFLCLLQKSSLSYGC